MRHPNYIAPSMHNGYLKGSFDPVFFGAQRRVMQMTSQERKKKCLRAKSIKKQRIRNNQRLNKRQPKINISPSQKQS